jgi:hypothetical protein
MVHSCYDPTLVKEPKSSHSQSISILFYLKDFWCFLRLADLLQSLAAEIILPTKTNARYGSLIWDFSR